MALRGGAHRNHDFPQIPKIARNVHEPYENLPEKMPKKSEKQKKSHYNDRDGRRKSKLLATLPKKRI